MTAACIESQQEEGDPLIPRREGQGESGNSIHCYTAIADTTAAADAPNASAAAGCVIRLFHLCLSHMSAMCVAHTLVPDSCAVRVDRSNCLYPRKRQ